MNFDSPYRWDLYDKYLALEKSGLLPGFKEPVLSPRNTIFTVAASVYGYRITTIGFTYFDMYTQKRTLAEDLSSKKLSAVACLLLAGKVFGVSPGYDVILAFLPNISSDELLAEERRIFDTLKNNLIVTNEYLFLEVYYQILTTDTEFQWTDEIDLAAKTILLYVLYNNNHQYLPSIVALASIWLACQWATGNDAIPEEFLQFYEANEIKEVGAEINKIYLKKRSPAKTVIRKFLGSVVDVTKLNVLSTQNKTLRILSVRMTDKRTKIVSPDTFQNERLIGGGSYADVYEVERNRKVIAYKKMFCDNSDGLEEATLKEISILDLVTHANVLSLDHVTFDSECYGVTFELMETDLSELIDQERENKRQGKDLTFTVDKVKRFSTQILHGLEYLHSNGIIHHDIKPANILVRRNDIKLADYGLSEVMVTRRSFMEYNFTFTQILTPPEVIIYAEDLNNQDVPFAMGYEVDVWMAGLVIGMMTSLQYILGAHEIFGEIDEGMIHEIVKWYSQTEVIEKLGYLLREDFDWDMFDRWEKTDFGDEKRKIQLNVFSDIHYDFIMSLLNLSPSERLTARAALLHPFLSS